jgi:hypothetical protein
MDIPPQTEIEKKRAAWWAENYGSGMTVEQVWRLNSKLIRLYPPTKEEREQKAGSLEAMPEFVL